MKKILAFIMLAGVIAATSCEPQTKDPVAVDIEVALKFNDETLVKGGVNVDLRALNGNATYSVATDANGVAAFKVLPGLYEASASFSEKELYTTFIYNGVNSSITVTDAADVTNYFVIDLAQSQSNQLVIKEFNFGACMDNDGKKAYGNYRYVILYNNGDTEIDASDVCLAFTTPANSNATNKYLVDGQLTYEALGYIPAGWAIWWFETEVKIAPYSQILIAINGAIDHTATYANAADLSNADYACYDPESGFNNATQYPAPDASVPTTNYMQTYRYGLGIAWPLSNLSPAFYILAKEDIETFVQNEANYDKTNGDMLPDVKVPVETVVDAIEVFDVAYKDKNNKRFPASIDSGYLNFTSKMGYTAYRNVDKDATEALPENKDKLVYNYAGGTADVPDGSTDPSGIDAEASIANGAHIVYKDTNNSTNDFHQRRTPSLRK